MKSLGLGAQEIARLNGTTDRILALELRKVRYLRSLSFVQGTAVNALRTSILFLMLYLIFARQITVGQFFSLLIYSFFIFGPLQELGTVINVYRETEVSLANFQQILDTPREPRPADAGRARPSSSALAFERRRASRHQSATRPRSQDVSFEVRRGETIAFVGPSGAGKTTLVKLLVGLYRPQRGPHPLQRRSRTTASTSTRCASASASSRRTRSSSRARSARTCSSCGPGASDAECLEVLQRAACDTLLARADRGLDTVIGEGGVKVSGGEKQRLSIARALLRRPQLLVFDEATSSLDSLTEEEIARTIRDVGREPQRDDHADRPPALDRACTPTASTCSSAGASSSRAGTTSCSTAKGLYYAMWRQQVGERRPGEGAGGRPGLRHAAGGGERSPPPLAPVQPDGHLFRSRNVPGRALVRRPRRSEPASHCTCSPGRATARARGRRSRPPAGARPAGSRSSSRPAPTRSSTPGSPPTRRSALSTARILALVAADPRCDAVVLDELVNAKVIRAVHGTQPARGGAHRLLVQPLQRLRQRRLRPLLDHVVRARRDPARTCSAASATCSAPPRCTRRCCTTSTTT